MPSFADSFWSEDLSSGLQVLFYKLYNGCNQCDAFIQLFASRMQFEVAYGRQLCSTQSGIDKQPDDIPETTAGKALCDILKHMEAEGDQHLNIASNIETLVLKPFSAWCIDHKERIKYSEKSLMDNVKNFQKSRNYVAKLEKDYFNKCKKLEDFKRINFANDDELEHAMKSLSLQKKHEMNLEKERDNQPFGTIGDIEFDFKTMREILKQFLTELPKTEYRLPLINYSLTNTNNGYEITKYILEVMSLSDTDQAERFGQDLLNLGFLKYCNGVGNTFVNSKKFQYQWKEYTYKFSRVESNIGNKNENEIVSSATQSMQDNLQRNFSNLTKYFSKDESGDDSNTLPSSLSNEDTIPTKQLSIAAVNSESTETSSTNDNIGNVSLEAPTISETEWTLNDLLKGEDKSNSKYFKECNKMDSLRCSIEELMIDHLSFMEKCELDRLKAIKKATLDFCSTISNKISLIKLQVDKMIEAEDIIDPTKDLLDLISNYNTGLFQPKVITYNNYYNPGIYQNFGIDLETRCRLDGRVVPLIATVILSYMDMIYPDMENDKIRIGIWTKPVKLSLTHQLRNQLNKAQFKDDDPILKIFKDGNYEPSTIASVLKIYLLELPEPLITSELTEILNVLYLEFSPENDNDESKEKRITGLYTTLSSLPKSHIATLDAITTHFYRLIKILKMATKNEDVDEAQIKEVDQLVENFTNDISKEFSNCIIHATKVEDNELGYNIFYDLLTHKKRVFKEMKRQSSSIRR